MTDEEKKKKDAEEYYKTAYDEIQKNKAENPPLIDRTLNQFDADPDKEWSFPGHAHPMHCLDQVINTRKRATEHKDPKEAVKLHAIATELEKKVHKRILFRQAFDINWRGKRRIFYVLWHRAGYQTDVWHCFAKNNPDGSPGWSEQDAKDFHAERTSNPEWTKPKMSRHEFYRGQIQQHISAEDQAKISAIRNQIPR